MYFANIYDLPVTANVCNQVLREVEKQPGWSMAHVVMNPLAGSRMHFHESMDEIYLITKGFGMLITGEPRMGYSCHCISAGSVFLVEKGRAHMLKNCSAGYLEHLVFALPPFDPSDVHLLDGHFTLFQGFPLTLPPVEDCFDGAKIISYAWDHLDMSIAFGWISNGNIDKNPHFHTTITEWVYVAEGQGSLGVDPASASRISKGDWIRIEPGKKRRFINLNQADLIIACICSPKFNMGDVNYI